MFTDDVSFFGGSSGGSSNGDTNADNKADNIKLTDSTLQLTSNGKEIGDPVELTTLVENIVSSSPEGVVEVVEF